MYIAVKHKYAYGDDKSLLGFVGEPQDKLDDVISGLKEIKNPNYLVKIYDLDTLTPHAIVFRSGRCSKWDSDLMRYVNTYTGVYSK